MHTINWGWGWQNWFVDNWFPTYGTPTSTIDGQGRPWEFRSSDTRQLQYKCGVANQLPIGSHDSNVAASCTVQGWAADPDNRSVPLAIKIYADGNPNSVAQGTANQHRDDLASAGVCPSGNCAFFTSLSETSVANGQPHSIRVHALDAQTGQEQPLVGTPKSILCPRLPGIFDITSVESFCPAPSLPLRNVITWEISTNATSYDVLCLSGCNSNNSPLSIITNFGETSFIHRDVSPGVPYLYQVLAKNEFGSTVSSSNGIVGNTTCTVPVNGVCGLANGVSSATPPSSGLCNAGTPTPVSDQGSSWVWQCLGSGEGSNASCSAPKLVNPENNAVCAEPINAPTTVTAGQSFTATVKMRNTGTKVWTNNLDPDLIPNTPHSLGSQSGQDNTRWGTGRVGLPGGASVAPNNSATFSFPATAPTNPSA
ncbi:MAG: hypothetical protein AAB834_05845, partial [Patescibacteria group bacterium]